MSSAIRAAKQRGSGIGQEGDEDEGSLRRQGTGLGMELSYCTYTEVELFTRSIRYKGHLIKIFFTHTSQFLSLIF